MEETPTVSLARALARPPLDAQKEGRRVEHLPGAHLNLKIGAPLVLLISALNQKYPGRVVGFEPYSYIIVNSRIPQDVLARLTENMSLVAQHTASGRVYGFRTQMLKRITTPAPLLFLAFPDTVDSISLHHNVRVDVNVLGALQGRYGEHPAMILDLTPSGCKLSVKIDLKNPLREAQVGDRLILSGQLGAGQPLVAPVELRRVAAEKGLMFLGAQFVDMSKETAEIIAAHIDGLLKFMDR